MPLKPVGGKLHLPLETQGDAERLFAVAIGLVDEKNPFLKPLLVRDIADHFYYLGAVHSALTLPLRERLTRLTDRQLEGFRFKFETWSPLLDGAGDEDADFLASQIHRDPGCESRIDMLAAIGTPYAYARLGEVALKHDLIGKVERRGFAFARATASFQPRFTKQRRAIKVTSYEGDRYDLVSEKNPIGLPLNAVAAPDDAGTIAWHYLTVDLTGFEGMPIFSPRLHVVSPRCFMGWTLTCEVQDDARYKTVSLSTDEEPEDDLDDLLSDLHNDKDDSLATAEFVPLDDRLTYGNELVLSPAQIAGRLGGPPIGLHPNPVCARCEEVMFHVLTIDNDLRSYSDGMISLFICEACRLVTCRSTGWN